MRINIVSYEPSSGWVLYDYACRLADELQPYVDLVDISNVQQPGYDVTFHINYAGLNNVLVPGIHCTLVTHIDTPEKFSLINHHARSGVIGYCMSEETARRLNALTGTRSFFNFAPPALLRSPEINRLNFMIASRVYSDGRKNEDWAINFFRIFNKLDINIRVIGTGWEPYVFSLKNDGYDVEYIPNFRKDIYIDWLKSSDYLLYTGHDEGALATLDALLYGVVPICTAQGYHLEQKGEILLFQTRKELEEIATKIKLIYEEKQANKLRLTDWGGFAKKHLIIWRKALEIIGGQQDAERGSKR